MAGIIYRHAFNECNIFRFSINRPLESFGVHFLSAVEIDKFVQQTTESGDCGGFQLIPGGRENLYINYLIDVKLAATERYLWVKLNESVIRPFRFRSELDCALRKW
jgi:hypothetical protein